MSVDVAIRVKKLTRTVCCAVLCGSGSEAVRQPRDPAGDVTLPAAELLVGLCVVGQ